MNTDHVTNGTSRTRAVTALGLDLVIPLAVFYGARAAGLDQWPALVLAAVAPAAGIVLTWLRQHSIDPPAVFVIAMMALSVVVALFTGDPRPLLARESWLTGVVGLWTLGSLTLARPFLLDVAIKISPAVGAHRIDQLWRHDAVFQRWIQVAGIAWGTAFLTDAAGRVAMAYTLPIDQVPGLGVLLLIVLLILAQAVVMVHGRRSGALALVRHRV